MGSGEINHQLAHIRESLWTGFFRGRKLVINLNSGELLVVYSLYNDGSTREPYPANLVHSPKLPVKKYITS